MRQLTVPQFVELLETDDIVAGSIVVIGTKLIGRRFSVEEWFWVEYA